MSPAIARFLTSGTVALCLSLATLAAGADDPPRVSALKPASARKPAPDFTLTDDRGSTITLSRYKGRVVLLDFWATWCTGCKVEIPWFMDFQKTYARQGLTSVGVSMDEEGWPVVKPYLQAHPINYPVVLGHPALEKAYPITNMPMTLLIDRAGRIADAFIGVVDREAWDREIQQLLKEPQ